MNNCTVCGEKIEDKGLFINVVFGEAKHIDGISFHVVSPSVVCSTDCMLRLLNMQLEHVKHWITDIYPPYKNIKEAK